MKKYSTNTTTEGAELKVVVQNSFNYIRNSYPTKIISYGKMCITKNLNIEVYNSWVFSNDLTFGKLYGQL